MFIPLAKTSPRAQTPLQSESVTASTAIWYAVDGVCALADSERHFGHAVLEGDRWLAFDAVHSNASRNGFACLGYFSTDHEARRAIEKSVGLAANSGAVA